MTRLQLRLGSVLVVAALAGCAKAGTGTPLPIGGMAGARGGAGGAGAGTGGAGGAPAGGDPLKCEPADATATPASLHAAAAAVLTTVGKDAATGVIGACTFSSCHVTPQGKAMLVLQGVTDLTTLRGKASCQAPAVPLVSAGGGDAALRGSWLYLKLVAPADPSNAAITPDPAWGSGGLCGTPPNKPFGERMPMSSGERLDATRLGAIRKWICAGAPMP